MKTDETLQLGPRKIDNWGGGGGGGGTCSYIRVVHH